MENQAVCANDRLIDTGDTNQPIGISRLPPATPPAAERAAAPTTEFVQ
jgi:hypothetical protein